MYVVRNADGTRAEFDLHEEAYSMASRLALRSGGRKRVEARGELEDELLGWYDVFPDGRTSDV